MDPKQVLPLRVKVDLGVMIMKEYFTFPKASDAVSFHIQDTHCVGEI